MPAGPRLKRTTTFYAPTKLRNKPLTGIGRTARGCLRFGPVSCRSRYCGAERTDAACKWAAAALNLLRLAKLSVSPPQAVARA
jgi:hypothetical protein